MSAVAGLFHSMRVSKKPIDRRAIERARVGGLQAGWRPARLIVLFLVATCIVLSGGARATAETPRSGTALIEGANAAIRSYDVRLTCTYRLFERKLAPVVREILGAKVSVSPSEFVSWDEAELEEHMYRQVYLNQGKYPVPLRRIEEFTADGLTRKSILAFDGTVRRSFYGQNMKGLVAAPPDPSKKFHQFVNYLFDYLTVVGMRVPSGYDPLTDLASKLPPEKVEIQDTDEVIYLNLHPSEPRSARRDGYRIWFDKQHGLMPREIQQYAVTADFNDVFVNEVDEDKIRWSEYNSLEISVEEFVSIDGGGWAPVRIALKARHDRGEYAGALVAQADIIVDAEKSTWNLTPADDQFAFDFPVGTRVTDDLRSVVFVVGDKDAGRNLDELIANAKSMMPTREEGRELAGWGKQASHSFLSSGWARAFIYLNAIGLLAIITIQVWRGLRRSRDARSRR